MGVVNFEQTRLEKLSVHFVGNKMQGEQLHITNNQFQLNDEALYGVLKSYFTNSFKDQMFYCFQQNDTPVVSIVKEMFESESNFHAKSKELAHFLFQCGTNKKIKSGEFFVTYFKEVIVDDELVDAVGIFKCENKDTFLKVFPKKDGEADLFTDKGISVNKIDKGCIIYNTFPEEGYKIQMLDNNSNVHTAMYWKTDYLGVTHIDTEYHMTNQYMELMKGFSKDCLTEQNEVTKEEQLDFLSKSSQYFNSSDVFDVKQFTEEIIVEPEMAETFMNYKETFEEQKHLPVLDSFGISRPAVEKFSGKFFRSVIKLDRNFHVYVHGNADMIERGFDEKKNAKFYKLYYKEEE